MPNINLRLTDEEHEALRVWALEGRRSIQREIIFRLFSERSGLSEGAAVGDEAVSGSAPAKSEEAAERKHLQPPSRPERAAPSESSDLHFKPDFKKPKK